MTAEQTTAVFRIVQEALTNVVRHAGASAIRIEMRRRRTASPVKIHDNGRGISGERARRSASRSGCWACGSAPS